MNSTDTQFNWFTVCVLLYGDSLDLAKRCLESLVTADFKNYVQDVRIGLNTCSPAVAEYAAAWATAVSRDGTLVRLIHSPQPLKYPTMRHMFRVADLASYVMWFDDDSYVTDLASFYGATALAASTKQLLGQPWQKPFPGGMTKWIATQKWADKRQPRIPKCKFFTGGWWVLLSNLVQKYDWPPKELRHKGGDMLLGELARHQNLRLMRYDCGVRINADANGAHSQAPRRGLSKNDSGELEIGTNYTGALLPTDHSENIAFKQEIFFPE